MISAFLKLVRINNLIIMLATMYSLKYLVIGTWINVALADWNFTSGLDDRQFFLLALSVVFVAAAGYIINDYFDISIDRVNKPDKLVLGVTIGKDKALTLHFILNIAGIALGFIVGSMIGIYKLGFIHAVTAGGLWFYSSSFKKQPLIGNVIVALAVAMVPLTVAAYEFPLLLENYKNVLGENAELLEAKPEIDVMIAGNLHAIGRFLLITTLFCFLMTLIRELIKDMQDMEGDAAFGSRSLPLAAGTKVTKIVITALIIFTLAMLGYIMSFQFATDKISFGYFFLALFIPLVILAVLVIRASGKSSYALLSKLTKGIMLAGIFYSLIYNYLLKHS